MLVRQAGLLMVDNIYTKATDGFQMNKFDVKEGTIEAVVTSFKNFDKVNDVIEPGALDEFLKQFSGGLPMLYQHDKNEIIGQWDKLTIRGDLVVGQGQIFPEVSRGADTMALVSRGMIGSTSIGFRSKEFEQNEVGGFNFKQIELVEISMVQSPANPKASLLSAKNDDGSLNIRNLEQALRDVGLSQKERKIVVSSAQQELRDVLKQENDLDKLTQLLKN